MNEKVFRNNLKSALLRGIVKVQFYKNDGSLRVMRCTLQPDVYEPFYAFVSAVQKKSHPDTLAVWDVDINEWRSFRYDRIKSFDATYA